MRAAIQRPTQHGRACAAAVVLFLLAAACGTDASPSTGTATTSQPATPAQEAARAALVEDLRLRLVQDGGCSNVPIDLDLVSAGLATFGADAQAAGTSAWNSLAEIEDTCSGDRGAWVDAIGATIQDLANLERQLGGPGPLLDSPDLAADADVRDISALAVTQFDRIHVILNNPAPAQASPHWLGGGEAVVIKGVRRTAANGEDVDVIIIGDSLAKHGVDVPALRDRGINVFNAAVAAASENAQAQVLSTSQRLFPDISTVVLQLHTHRMFLPCNAPDQRFDTAVAARESVFTGVPEAAGIDPYDLLLGSDPANPQQLLDGYNLSREAAFGNATALEGRNDERRAVQLRTDVRRYESPSVCDQRVDDVGAQVAALVADGQRVVVLIAPQSQELAVLHPEGRAAHAAAVASIETQVTVNGGELLDLSMAVSDEDFHDLTHVNEAGRVIFTDELATVLEAG